MRKLIEEVVKTDPFRTGWQTLEGKITAGGLTIASGVLLKLTGIDFVSVFKNDPVETAKAVDKAANSITVMAEAYKSAGQFPVEFFTAIKFGMVLVFMAFLISRYIDRRYKLKALMIESKLTPEDTK